MIAELVLDLDDMAAPPEPLALALRIAYTLAGGTPVHVAPLGMRIVRWLLPGGDDPRRDSRRWPKSRRDGRREWKGSD